MSNLKLDSSHDIIIGRGTTKVAGDEYIIQLVKCRLLFVLNTWELDLRLGLPWIEDILVKDPDNALVQGLLRDTITKTPGVASVNTMDLNFNQDSRKLNVNFTAKTDNDTLISQGV